MTRTGTDTATYTLATDPGTVTVTGTIEPTERGRYFAGEIEPIPTTWQSLFGSVFETSGPELSIDGCEQSSGPTFQQFNLADVTAAGNAVPTHTALGYTYDFDPSNPAGYMQSRSLSGPFPLAENDVGANYYPATLSAAPAVGDVAETFTIPASVSATATLTKNSATMDVTAVNSGTISNSGIFYNVSDASFTGTATLTSGSTVATINSTTTGSLQVGAVLSGTGIPNSDAIASFGTYTVAAGTGTVNLATNATASVGPESVTGSVIPSGTQFYPAYQFTPGTSLSTGNYTLAQGATASVTGDSVTLAPASFDSSTYWKMWFGDGETRIGKWSTTSGVATFNFISFTGTATLANTSSVVTIDATTYGSLAVGDHFTGTDIPAGATINSFGTYTVASGTGTINISANATGTVGPESVTGAAPLTGCTSGSPCSASLTVAPMGDNYSSAYDGSYAGAFIVPNTRTLVTAWVHNSGPHTDKGSAAGCSANASGSYSTPLVPDTSPYQSIRLYLYDLQDVENGAQGTQPVYQANPYGFLDFPDSANLFPSGCVSLSNVYASGFMRFDASNDILYMATGSGAPTIVDEYQVTPP